MTTQQTQKPESLIEVAQNPLTLQEIVEVDLETIKESAVKSGKIRLDAFGDCV